MSDPLRVAVALEGPTDAIVLEAILNALLPNAEFVLQTLESVAEIFDVSVQRHSNHRSEMSCR